MERVGATLGSLFCCERSESPAGGAALTICQRRHAYFPRPPGSSGLRRWRLSSPEQESPETKALDRTSPDLAFTAQLCHHSTQPVPSRIPQVSLHQMFYPFTRISKNSCFTYFILGLYLDLSKAWLVKQAQHSLDIKCKRRVRQLATLV